MSGKDYLEDDEAYGAAVGRLLTEVKKKKDMAAGLGIQKP